MTMTLTESAARQIRRQIGKRGSGIGLRIGIRKMGCSGLAHTFEIVDEIAADDHSFEEHGARLVLDAGSFAALDGSHIDFVTEGLTQRFRFDNPNIASECGCGESFNLKTSGDVAQP